MMPALLAQLRYLKWWKALHPSVHKDFWEEAYCIVKAAIEAADLQDQREARRLKPSAN